ncbi:hypothetical protein MAR_013342 [Mya arenaria]|uniref:Uncharacterized protein n=1 Tax=Mya arenaria TaxID=6604 RepID=A0ABY7G3B6_MYAAR|nr:hypothetical protein MAR_013342 [Mya arenaria]
MILIFFFEILVIGLGCIHEVTSSHFRGGSIFWKPGNGFENCDLTIDASLDKHGVYALAITIEDKPTSTITIGSTPYFVLLTPDLPTRSCSDKPVFLDPTPSENDVHVYRPGDNVSLSFYATSRAATIISFTLLDPPTNVRQSALRNDDTFRPDVYAMDLTWTPVAADRGSKTICVEATDNFLYQSMRQFTISDNVNIEGDYKTT